MTLLRQGFGGQAPHGESDLAYVLRVYTGSDGEATKALYRRLESHGPAGFIATNLFRACKCSERAKVYRGGGYRGAAYDRKQWSMDNLAKAPTVTDVRLERLQAISEDDAIAEGVTHETADPPFYYVPGIMPHSLTAVGIEEPGERPHAVRSYAKLWTLLHGDKSWTANPDVIVFSFRPELMPTPARAPR